MTEAAGHLVDHVIPRVPGRQVVVSFHFRARVPLGYDAALNRSKMAAVTTIVMRWLASRAKRMLGLVSVSLAHGGGVAFQQRFDSALRLNPHLHILVTDGVFLDAVDRPRFVVLPSPSPDELADLARRLHVRCARIFAKHGRSFDPDAVLADDDLQPEDDLLAHLYDSAASGRSAVATQPVAAVRLGVAAAPGLPAADPFVALGVGGRGVERRW